METELVSGWFTPAVFKKSVVIIFVSLWNLLNGTLGLTCTREYEVLVQKFVGTYSIRSSQVDISSHQRGIPELQVARNSPGPESGLDKMFAEKNRQTKEEPRGELPWQSGLSSSNHSADSDMSSWRSETYTLLETMVWICWNSFLLLKLCLLRWGPDPGYSSAGQVLIPLRAGVLERRTWRWMQYVCERRADLRWGLRSSCPEPRKYCYLGLYWEGCF